MPEDQMNPAAPAGASPPPVGADTLPPPRPLFPINEGSMAQRGIHDLMSRWVEQDLRGEDLYLSFLESLPPALLFHESCTAAPAMYLALRDLLLDRDVSVRKGRGVVIVQALAELYEDADHRSLAKALLLPDKVVAESGGQLSSIVSGDARVLASSASPPQSMGYRVSSKYKDEKSKFSGAIGQSWSDYSSAYIRFLGDCNIPKEEGAKYMHNVLTLDALRFYTDNCRPTDPLDEQIAKIEAEFNSRTRQNQVKNELSALRLPVLVAKKSCSVQEALEFIRSEISSKIQLCPSEYRTEAHKRECLRNAVLGLEWSRDALGRAESNNWSFQTLCSELLASIGAYEEGLLALQKDKVQSRRSGSRPPPLAPSDMPGIAAKPESNPTILFAGQNKYAVHPRRNFHRNRGNSSRKSFGKRLCYNCKSPDHLISDCPKPLSAEQIARRAFRKVDSMETAKSAMINLVQQYGFEGMLNGSDSDSEGGNSSSPTSSTGNDDDSENDDAVFFVHSTAVIEGMPDRPYHNLISIPTRDAMLKSSVTHEVTPPWSGSGHIDKEDRIHEAIEVDITPRRNTLRDVKHVYETFRVAKESYSSKSFQGCCVDTGATSSVIGHQQARAYCNHAGIKLKLNPSKRTFKFADTTFKSLGKLPVRIPTPNYGFIEQNVDVVEADVPLLLGLDTLDKEGMYVNNVINKIVHHQDGWEMDLERKFGHMFMNWPANILFTTSELTRMHRHFYHPSATKLFNLIKRAVPKEATPETLEVLKRISKACDPCQRMGTKPITFQVSMPDGIVFNHQLAMDLMWVQSEPVLHVVDTHTHFSSAQFLRGESTSSVWFAFLSCWATLYIGFPDSFLVDQGSVFTSHEFQAIAASAGVELRFTPTESHNSLGAGERYHAPLRRIYLKIQMDFPRIPKELALALANKAMNDTCGPEGIVPSLLVFGAVPRIPFGSSQLPEQHERMQAIAMARAEMETIVAEQRVKMALKRKLPPASAEVITPGQLVLVYREKEKQWVGPVAAEEVEGKTVRVRDFRGQLKPFSVTVVKPYVDPSTVPEILFSSLRSLFRSPSPGLRASVSSVLLTEEIHRGDERIKDGRFEPACMKEMEGLKKRGTFEFIPRHKVPKGANIIGGRFVYTIKNIGTANEIYKARFVAQGHTDREKDYLLHCSTTLHHYSIRLVVSVAAMFNFRIWTHDVTQAYLQSSDLLSREVYLRPNRFIAPKDFMLKLKRPLYGLSDAGDYWDVTKVRHYKEDLGMNATTGDASLFYKRNEKGLLGLAGTYVDDSLQCGTSEFAKLTEKTSVMFESKDREFDQVTFSGMNILAKDGGFDISQADYVGKLQPLAEDCQMAEYRSLRAKLLWITHSRPDISCAVALSTQVTPENRTPEDVKMINKVVRHLRQTKSFRLRYRHLDPDTLRIAAYCDASFAGNKDLTSQLGMVIFLADGSSNCNLIHYGSYKDRRVTRAILAGEIHAFSTAFDFAFMLQFDLKAILGKHVPLQMFTDSKSLFDLVTTASYTAEKRLMIDIAAIRQSFRAGEIDDIGHVLSEHNPADSFTKIIPGILQNILETGKLNHPVQQWIIKAD